MNRRRDYNYLIKTLIRATLCFVALFYLLSAGPVSYAADPTFTYDTSKRGDAVTFVRKQLLSRVKKFDLVYDFADKEFVISETTHNAIKEAFGKQEWDKLSSLLASVVGAGLPEADDGWALLSDATAHTGVGDEGDYLINGLNGTYGIISSPNYGLEFTGGVYKLTVDKISFSFEMNYFTTADQETKFKTEAKKVMTSLNLSSLSDYEKICEIYKYIADNVTYDKTDLNTEAGRIKQTAYSALINKKAVCQGYSTLFYYMANESGLDCRIVKGNSKNPQGGTEHHAWNLIKLGAKYYYVDVTWDACRKDEYKYFLKGSDSAELSDHELFGLDKMVTENEYIDPSTLYDIAKKNYYDETGVTKTDISSADIKIENAKYDNGNCSADITVTLGGKVLTRLIDYKVTFIEYVTNTGKCKLSITGVGMYKGTVNRECNMTDISKKDSTSEMTTDSSAKNISDQNVVNVDGENVVFARYDGQLKKGGVYMIGYYKYKITKLGENGTIEVVGAASNLKTVIIPDKIIINSAPYKVTSIGAKAFKGNKKLKEATIGKYVKKIGAKAFYGCKKLGVVNIRTRSLKTVGSNAFKKTKSKAKVTVPKGKKSKYKKLLRKRGLSKKAKVSS